MERLEEFREKVQQLREENIPVCMTSDNEELTREIQSVLDESETETNKLSK